MGSPFSGSDSDFSSSCSDTATASFTELASTRGAADNSNTCGVNKGISPMLTPSIIKDQVLEMLQEKPWTVNDFKQMFQVLSPVNQFDELKGMVISLKEQVQGLTEQLRLSQLSYYARFPPPFPPPPPPPVTDDLFSINIKTEDKVLRTPKKTSPEMQQLIRQDFSPRSTSPDEFQQHYQLPLAGHNHNSFFKRSLEFPQSLGDLLDHKKIKKGRSDAFGWNATQPNCDNGSVSQPLETIQIKQEMPDDSDNQKTTGLLMLADIALGNPESSDKPEQFTDSGRSSDGSFAGSPVSQYNHPYRSHHRHREDKSMYKVKRGSRDTKIKILLPKPSHSSNYKSSSDETESCSSMEAKSITRKRRKTKQPLPCSYCGKLFNNQSSLRQHESFHRPVRPFKCDNPECDKAYKTRSELNRHLVVHSGEKKHCCKMCGKRFLRKQYLKTHLLRHHENGDQQASQEFKGPSTGEMEGYKVQADTFAKQVNCSGPASFVNKGTWKCDICLRVYLNHEEFARHVRSHNEKETGSAQPSLQPTLAAVRCS